MSIVKSEIRTGTSTMVGDLELFPKTQVLRVTFPGHHAGFIWNRPKAVVVRAPNGEERNLPVTDVTRIAIWAMLAGGLIGSLVIRAFYWNK